MKKFWRIALPLIAVATPATSPIVHAVEFGAFADVNFSDSDASGASNTFALGGLDLYATQQIDEHSVAFIEYVFENDGEGFIIDLERLWIRRQFTPAFEIAAGRFHAPLGYWNRHYHHGVLIQDTVSRPSFLDFEDGEGAILPMHIIGVMATGELGMGSGNLGYEVAIANSASFDTELSNNAAGPSAGGGLEIGLNNISDPSNDKSLVARITYGLDSSPWEVGLFGMSGSYLESGAGDANFGSLSAGDKLVDQTVYGLDFNYQQDPIIVLAEYYQLDNDSKIGAGSHSASAYYVQLAYQVTNSFRPAYRFESLSGIDANDTYFRVLDTIEGTRHVLALRFDLDDTNAITMEWSRSEPDAAGLESVNEYIVDWAFMLF